MPDQRDEKSSSASNCSQPRTQSLPRLEDEHSNSPAFPRCRSLRMGKRSSEKWLIDCRQALTERFSHSEPATKSELLSNLNSMMDGVSHPIDQAARIRKLAELVKTDVTLKKVIRESGALALVIHAMASFCSVDADIQVAGFEVIVSVSEDTTEAQEAMVSLEGVEAILDGMRTHPNSAGVQNWGARALRALAWGRCNRQTMISYGALHDILTAMRNHPGAPGIQEHIASTIAQVVYGSPESKALVGTTGGIQLILSAMRNHPQNMNLQGQCCFALRNLSWESPENHLLMHEHGADALLISALDNFPRVPGLQDQALAALGNLMFHDEQTFRITIEGRDSLVLHNALFSALRTFPTNTSITSNAFNLLINMCELSKADRIRHLRRIATTPDIVRLLCKPIQEQSTRTIESVTQVSALIISLSVVVEFQNSLRAAKVLELLLSCIKQYVQKEPGQCALILDALHSALSGNDESKKQFNQIGGVALLAEIMTEAYSTEILEEKACMVLDNVSNGQFEATAEKMNNRKEAMKSVLASMINFPANNKLQEFGCSVMIKVAATSAQDAAQLIDMGAGPVVEKARVVHKGIPAVESLANQLLTLLVPSDGARNTRGQAVRGTAGTRLRSRSRTVEKGARSRSSMGRSKSPVKKRGMLLESVDENPNACDEIAEESLDSGNREAELRETASTSSAPVHADSNVPEDQKRFLASSKLHEADKYDKNASTSGNDLGKGQKRPSEQPKSEQSNDHRGTTCTAEKHNGRFDPNNEDRTANVTGVNESSRGARPIPIGEAAISSHEHSKGRRHSLDDEDCANRRESRLDYVRQRAEPHGDSGTKSNIQHDTAKMHGQEIETQSRRERESRSARHAAKCIDRAMDEKSRNERPEASPESAQSETIPRSSTSSAANSSTGEFKCDQRNQRAATTLPGSQPLYKEKHSASSTIASDSQENETSGISEVCSRPIERTSTSRSMPAHVQPSDASSHARGSTENAPSRTDGRRGRREVNEFEREHIKSG